MQSPKDKAVREILKQLENQEWVYPIYMLAFTPTGMHF
jgi:hypothetical protein